MVLGDWESLALGEGINGGAQPAKDTRAGQIGLEQHEPTSPRVTALGQRGYAHAGTTEEPDAGKPHVRVRAGGVG